MRRGSGAGSGWRRKDIALCLGLTALAAFGWPSTSRASGICLTGVAWPRAEIELPLNPVFQLSVCEDSLRVLRPSLRSESGEEIALDFIRDLHDRSPLVQPRIPLRPLTRYRVSWRGVAPDKTDPVYRTGSDTDFRAPQWRALPRLDAERSDIHGGPRAALTAPLENAEEPLLALVSFRKLSDEEFVRSWPQASETEGDWTGIRIGGSEDWHPGALAYSAEYVATISFLDLGGNESEPRTVLFRTPEAPPEAHCQAFTSVAEGTVRRKEEPACTSLAVRARVSGTVEGFFTATPDGSVVSVKIEKGLPMGLDERTREALSTWILQPSRTPGERKVAFKTVYVLATEAWEPTWKALPP